MSKCFYLPMRIVLLSMLFFLFVACSDDGDSISAELESPKKIKNEFDTSMSAAQFSSSEVEFYSSSMPALSSSSAVVPLSSSINLFSVPPAESGIPYLRFTTLNSIPVDDTVFVECTLEMNGAGYDNYIQNGVRIRQRGNSTRIYYDKKPYRIKLPKKFGLLGLAPNKDWVLLANYRDPTAFMNAVVFDMARSLSFAFAFVNSNRFVEVEINGEYLGMYQLTEQIERSTNRVNIDKSLGRLLSLDADDGPELSSNSTNNFYSTVYGLPVAVKYPKALTSDAVEKIRGEFAELENFIKNGKYDSIQNILDVTSFIDFLIIQEITRNVELVTPRSMNLYKDQGVWHFGPLWDFDGGFAFDWESMTEGHGYFESESWLMGSENPATARDAYDRIPRFFTDLFNVPEFVLAYKTRWNSVSSMILPAAFDSLDSYAAACALALAKNAQKWPIGKDYAEETTKMKKWLQTRVNNYSMVVKNF